MGTNRISRMKPWKAIVELMCYKLCWCHITTTVNNKTKRENERERRKQVGMGMRAIQAEFLRGLDVAHSTPRVTLTQSDMQQPTRFKVTCHRRCGNKLGQGFFASKPSNMEFWVFTSYVFILVILFSVKKYFFKIIFRIFWFPSIKGINFFNKTATSSLNHF